MAIQEIQENDLIKDSREVINDNFTELDEGKLSLSGGTMTGPLFMTGANDRIVGFEVKDDGTNFDCGWNFANRDGAGFALRSTDFNNDGGSFHFWARNATNSPELVGKPNGTLTWNGSNVITAAGGTMTGNLKFSSGYISKSTDTAALSLNGGSDNESGAYLNLYGKSHASSAGAFSLSAYDGTTRKQLVGLVNGTLTWNGTSISLSGHTHSYLPLSGGTMTGQIKRNGVVVANTADNGYVQYNGGKDDTSSYICIYGKSHSSSPGTINIRAYDGTNSNYLQLKPNGSLTWGGLDISPQAFSYSGTSSDVSVPNNTVKNLISFTLTKGTWLVIVNAGFANHSTGYRALGIATSTTSQNMDRNTIVRAGAATGSNTNLSLSCMLAVSSSTTYYVNVLQTSGSSLNVSGGSMRFRLSAKV